MEKLLEGLTIEYRNIDLYITALTHPSYVHEHHNSMENNQRLEFIGDAVFDLVISEFLYNNLELNEGEMTKLRATYVCEKALSVYATSIDLHKYILLGKGEKKAVIKDAIIADAFEAFVAAIYLDLGLDAVKLFFNNNIRDYIINGEFEYGDYKSRLQELVQSDKRTIVYKVEKSTGPSHDPIFYVNVYMDDIVLGSGSGNSKKTAEQMAAKCALAKMAR